ncbi:Nodulation protein NolG [Halomicronema hongdechloris C2206]|uniref:Nodulation protein NolG n=1 Tax=Halomicronema hongdechloris C2206 TaxID=1641165 RepID=A0A1Z3HKS2_9CYAN|nr:efflux RND transporter permease subunit [Halomicronema hongdechloris]ASC70911.1 Nodulation protein NolG [Halomicronema hongdechloris C2206]
MFSRFYRHPRLLILALILIGVWGISAFQSLPRLEDPELVSRNAVVTTFWPGASAERIEALVTENIEAEITDIPEILTYESTSRPGSSIVEIELSEHVQAGEVDGIWSRVRDRLEDAAVAFPPGTTAPDLEQVEVKAYALVVALTWTRPDPPNYRLLRRLAAALKERLQALPGTEAVDVFGDPEEALVVEVDPARLAGMGLTAQSLSQQIRQSDAKVAAGQVRSPEHTLPLAVAGALDSLARLAQIPIRLGDGGQTAYLGDLAQLRRGTLEPLQELALAGGQPAVVLGALVQSDYRLDRWAQQAYPLLQAQQTQLASDLEIEILFDQSRYVSQRLRTLLLNLLLGAILVFGVTLGMMGWQAAVIVGVALPLTLLLVIGLMDLLAIPLHQMSITGLIVALGILIDTAIVMVDEVHHHLNQGEATAVPPQVAIDRSGWHLAVPLLSSTLTTVLAFMPIALLPGSVGEFVGTIGLTVILAVSCSLVLSMTVIPALAAYLHRGRLLGASWWQRGLSLPWLAHGYDRLLGQTLRRPLLGIALALLLPGLGLLQAPFLEQQFFPASDRDQLTVELELSAAASIQQTQAMGQRLRQRLRRHPQVDEVHWFVGSSAPRFYYNLTGGREHQANYGQALVQLHRLSSPALTHTLQAEVDRAFPTVRAVVRQLEQGPPFEAPIEVRLFGHDLQQLRRLGQQVRSQLVALEAVTHTRASLDETLPQLEFVLDETAVRLAGLDHGTVAQRLDQVLEGVLGGSVLETTEDLPVQVRLTNADRASLDQIAALPLALPGQDDWLPLDSLGAVQLVPKPAQIGHYNGERVNQIQGFVRAGVLPATVLAQFQQRLQTQTLPPGYRLEFGGEAEERSQAIGNLVSTVGVLGVLLVSTLVLSLGSFRLAALIGVVAIAAIGLGLFSVASFGYPFGFNPIIGTVGLIGVAINDSIVVLAALDSHPQARLGDRRAIQAVVSRSTRHVLATTFTTMVGFVPLLLAGGAFWPPLAVAIAGGVGGATFLALFLIPSAYRWLQGRHGAPVAPTDLLR